MLTYQPFGIMERPSCCLSLNLHAYDMIQLILPVSKSVKSTMVVMNLILVHVEMLSACSMFGFPLGDCKSTLEPKATIEFFLSNILLQQKTKHTLSGRSFGHKRGTY